MLHSEAPHFISGAALSACTKLVGKMAQWAISPTIKKAGDPRAEEMEFTLITSLLPAQVNHPLFRISNHFSYLPT